MLFPFLSRPAMLILACIGFAACASSPSPPERIAISENGRSSHSSGVAYRDTVIRSVTLTPMVSLENDPRLGSAKAAIGIVEFSDYQCLACRAFHREQFPRLKKEYVDTGMVQMIHKDLPLRTHAQAVPAAMSAHCAGAQGRFWEMHDALFVHQGRLGPSLYPELARGLKLDKAKFKDCLENQVPETGIREDVNLARRLGLTGTPTFLIGKIEGNMLTVSRRIRGVPGFESFIEEIEKLRKLP